ncbi:MAG: sugar ABC transporter permease, partial [Arenibacterium sp.]
MSDVSTQPLPAQSKGSLFQKLEVDTRLLGMIGAFVILCIGFNILTDGRFLTPRNIFNLTIQTVSVAIMACGMVFVIVNRHIDLSVGALLATTSAVMAMTQTHILPNMLGMGLGHPLIWILTIIVGLFVGTLIGAFQGWMVGYLTIPAFIVTLGGFLVWRNVAWYMTDGQTIGPLDSTFLIFGGTNGTLGTTWSWGFAFIAALLAVWTLWNARRAKAHHGFPVKPVWAEMTLSALIVGLIFGFISILNAYEIPTRRLQRMFEARG